MGPYWSGTNAVREEVPYAIACTISLMSLLTCLLRYMCSHAMLHVFGHPLSFCMILSSTVKKARREAKAVQYHKIL